LVGYYLDESNDWAINLKELERAYKAKANEGKHIKAMVVINPGNPTGNLLSKANIAEIIKFCYDKKLILLADEVYQTNIYSEELKFHSFKKVLSEIGYPYNRIALASFHSISKGFIGECGIRGGYTELVNFPEEITDVIFKLRHFDVLTNISGQIILDLMVNPPTEENVKDEVYKEYFNESSSIIKGLKEKAILMCDKLNKMKNFKCNKINGAMYAFPRIFFSNQLISHAKSRNMEPDLFYSLELLEKTGIVIVPGSGFGQKEGTYHIRMTNLINPKSKLIETLDKVEEFNQEFLNKYN